MEAYSLFEVNQYIRRVIALNFEEAIWVECEIKQISQSRGNTYLELIEKKEDSDEIIAKTSGTLWYRQLMFVKKKLGKLAEEVLSAGIKVKLKCNVEYSERYGLSLNILDIDPSYTFGQFELNRQQIIDRLIKEDLMDLNKALDLPSVIQRIAVISSETAAGYQDFINEIYNNNYAYAFDIDIYQSAMQGQNTEREVCLALDSIDRRNYDIIIIIRGGGSKLDLSAFDNYEIASRIAKCDLPVFTGIGHEIDQSICDLVSHNSLKTPTAVAGFIIDYNLGFESEIDHLMEETISLVSDVLYRTKQDLSLMQNQILAGPKLMIQEKQMQLKLIDGELKNISGQRLNRRLDKIQAVEQLLASLDPSNVLKRGYALLSKDGRYLSRKEQLKKEDGELDLEMYDGKIKIKKV